jgi:hypothetical protein
MHSTRTAMQPAAVSLRLCQVGGSALEVTSHCHSMPCSERRLLYAYHILDNILRLSL